MRKKTNFLIYSSLFMFFIALAINCNKSDNGDNGGNATYGTPCPGLPTFTDSRDGTVYPTVQIGSQCWMAKNLAYLPSVVGTNTSSDTIPYYYVYGYNGTSVTTAKTNANYSNFGVLYNWPAAMAGSASSIANPSGVQGICPSGWHLPSDVEWKQLEMHLGMSQVDADIQGNRGNDEGGKLKETSTTYWANPNTGATNETGFSALPGGVYTNVGFFQIGNFGRWWSATEDTNYPWTRSLMYDNSNVRRSRFHKDDSYSIRCVKDN